jgi:hypothetical protein
MPRTQHRRHSPLARRGASVPRLGRPRPKAAGKAVNARRSKGKAHDVALIERELAELGDECGRVRRLLRQLASARRSGSTCDGILGELGASVLHLHVHTKGLDALIDEIE